jgi:hypothetical protein
MVREETIADRILKAVRRAPGCQLDALEQHLPGLTWNQIFLEVDRLSRAGQVRVTPKGDGLYTVRPPLRSEKTVKVRAVAGPLSGSTACSRKKK